MAKKVFQITGGTLPVFAWRLPREIATYKQPRMQAQQWINVIKGFSQKGVKQAEIDESSVITWLEAEGKNQVTREELAQHVSFALPSIKEARLSGSDVRFRGWAWVGAGDDYNESLFYFPTVVEDLGDRIADLDDAIAALNFDFDALGNDPDLVFRLDAKRNQLMTQQHAASNGVTISTHFSGTLRDMCPDARADFAHMRWSVLNLNGERTLFIHELQSDWAQKGRANDWKTYKRAPLVTETEHWTAFLMRRAMTLAVEQKCCQVTWINGAKMANGGGQGAEGLDEFYMKIVTSIAKKLAKPFDSALALKDFTLKGQTHRLAVMPVTTQMSEHHAHQVPVYSHARVLGKASFDAERAAKLQRALQLRADQTFGKDSMMRVSIVREILDAHEQGRAAGALIGRVAQVAFNAEDPVAALDHESFHFAYRHHFTSKQRQEVDEQFSAGAALLVRTVRLLLDNGDTGAAMQAARSPEEAAAHAYSFWRKGKFPLDRVDNLAAPHARTGVRKMLTEFFPTVTELVSNVCAWIRGTSVSPTDFVAKVVRAAEGASRASRNEREPLHDPDVSMAHEQDREGLALQP